MRTLIALVGLFFLSGFVCATAHGFSKERCGKLFPQADSDHPYYYSPIYVTTMMPSTTSYFSSIGPCSMYGEFQSATRATFIQESLPAIRVDAARGGGEYLKALAQLTGCPEEQYEKVASVMHSQFSKVFATTESNSDLLMPAARIDSAMRTDASLKMACPGLN